MIFLKAVCHSRGHDWKDGHTVGEVKYAFPWQMPKPFKEGQYPVIGNPISCVTAEHFKLSRAGLLESLSLLPQALRDWFSDIPPYR